MAAEQLQRLRDIHVPAEPSWWPPAPGWWLVALLVAAAAVWLAWHAYSTYRRRRPVRQAQRLYENLYQRYRQGEMSRRAYLHETNELIKRVLIHGLGEHRARRASGESWLALLDAHLQTAEFSSGPGRALGNSRFRPPSAGPQPHDDDGAAELHGLVERLLQHLAPESAGPHLPRPATGGR